MGWQIVHDHHVAGRELGHQDVLDIGAEGGAIHRAVEDHRRGEAGEPQPGGEGGGLPMAVWHGGPAALPSRRPAAQARHLGGGAGLVDEDQALRVEVELAVEPGLARRLDIAALLLGRMRGLFLSVMRRRRKKRQMLVSPTPTPRSFSFI